MQTTTALRLFATFIGISITLFGFRMFDQSAIIASQQWEIPHLQDAVKILAIKSYDAKVVNYKDLPRQLNWQMILPINENVAVIRLFEGGESNPCILLQTSPSEYPYLKDWAAGENSFHTLHYWNEP